MKHYRGKRTKQWESARRKLKIQFESSQIVSCEMCGSRFALSFSHKEKRRYITTEEQLFDVILLCQIHHTWIENHPDKVNIHEEIKALRGVNYVTY